MTPTRDLPAGLVHTLNHFLSLSSFLSSRQPSSQPTSLLPPGVPAWRPPGWRPSAARTETRPPSSWSPSSRCCSGLWVWGARVSASSSPFYKFCPNAKDTGDWGSTRCRGPRPPRGYCSSSACVTSWDAQVKRNCFLARFSLSQLRETEVSQRGEALLAVITHENVLFLTPLGALRSLC